MTHDKPRALMIANLWEFLLRGSDGTYSKMEGYCYIELF